MIAEACTQLTGDESNSCELTGASAISGGVCRDAEIPYQREPTLTSKYAILQANPSVS